MYNSILAYSQKAIFLANSRNLTLKNNFGEYIISIEVNERLFTNYRKRVDRIFSKSSRYSNHDDNEEMIKVRDIGFLKSQVSNEWELFLDTLHRYHSSN